MHETLQHLLKQQGKATWRQIRAMAEEDLASGPDSLSYIVALAGFINSCWYGNVPVHMAQEEEKEFLAIDQRTIFVGMTRAMRALLMTVPAQTNSPLLQGFDATYWNLGG